MTLVSSMATGLLLISAGAGSGKTHRLTRVVTEALDPRGLTPVAPEGLVAVTYTRKAAAELEARVRQTLIGTGANGTARELALAQLGTVHAVCLRWLRELAIDAGLSPLANVLPGDEAAALRHALEWGLSADLSRRLDSLAERLDIRWDARTKRWDWLDPVQNVMTLARSNRISPAALRAMGECSSQRLRSLMGRSEADPVALDAELSRAVDDAWAALAPLDTGQKNTREARLALDRVRRRLASGSLRWSEWIALQKLDAGKAARNVIAPLASVARRVDRHPRLHEHVHEFILAVYDAATVGLEAYDQWKRERRLVDFVDMVDQCLTLLDAPDVRSELERRLALCVVDEFQDTSPAQLALFVKLHEICGSSTWVGDSKQCIFEYAGADPELMAAVTSWAGCAGGLSETLLDNWRSRPELVNACSRLFAAAFLHHGYPPEQVAMSPQRPPLPELDALPPFAVWWLEGRNREQAADAMAEGVVRMLREPSATVVIDRNNKRPRALRPGDIAVLVATNAEAERVTSALADRGIRAAVARAGLLSTPEGTLVEASLSYVADRQDARSLAVVETLTGLEGQSPELWLESKVARHTRFLDARQRGEPFEPGEPSRVARDLDRLRRELPILAPSEALDRVLTTLDVAALCARWPRPEQRLSNLEALRTLAARYETRCHQHREAASVAGLLRFFEQAKQKVVLQDEERASDDQHTSAGPESVTVTTYHRAKGLEWSIVVLGSLDREERRDAFTVLPESRRESFDPTDPLGGRWIRYFPWPYGLHRNAPLADAVATAAEGQEVQHREVRERVRLLYVGFTRARDHLILAVRTGRQGPKAAWLDELCDATGAPLLSLPAWNPHTSHASLGIRGADGVIAPFPARVLSLQRNTDGAIQVPTSESTRWFARPRDAVEQRSPYSISPSRGQRDWPELEVGDVGEIVLVGSRLSLGSKSPKDWNRVGDTLHAFLAADVPALTLERRLECAERLLVASRLLTLIDPSALVHASNSLREWVGRSWPEAIWHRELPVSGMVATPHGLRRVDGIIDLLLETRGGVVLVDHKSYPGRRDTWRDKASQHAPQLAAYAQVLRMAGKNVLSQWISFAVTGAAVQVNQQRQLPRAASGV